MARRMRTILLVDDDDDYRLTAKWFLGSLGYEVEPVRKAEEALAVFNPKIHDIVVTDNRMSGMTSSELAHIIKLRSPTTPVLMFTGMAPDDQSCLDAVVQRPTHLLLLKDTVDALLSEKP